MRVCTHATAFDGRSQDNFVESDSLSTSIWVLRVWHAPLGAVQPLLTPDLTFDTMDFSALIFDD